MINEQLINPQSIVVVGASNDVEKPGGKILKNIIDGGYSGKLYVTNLKESEVQGIPAFSDPSQLPQVDLAILAIAARFIPETVEILAHHKQTRAFIILSAGFSEESKEGKLLEDRIVETITSCGGVLIGPNCIGVLTPRYHGVFTLPIPKLNPFGCDFISGSGATACFIMEAGIPRGLSFANVFSVGNSAQTGVEEILEYMDITFDPSKSSKIKLLYIENIQKPAKLLKHASSLIQKGCRIAAVKAGSSEAGSRAASSHTGAMASPDAAVDALFKKAGIVRCSGRDELITVASVFMYPPLKGKNIAVITHAGGPAVMLTDALSNGGLQIPQISGEKSRELLEKLFPGSSVNNPIDFLATGTAEQLGHIIDYTDQYFEDIDGMAVIFGTPGLFRIFDVYRLLDRKMRTCRKPIYPVLPSILTATDEITEFLSLGRVNFPDEVSLGKALAKVYHTSPPDTFTHDLGLIDTNTIRTIVGQSSEGYLSPEDVGKLIDAVEIPRSGEATVTTIEAATEAALKIGFPLVLKVVGPVHKSDVGGVVLNVSSEQQVRDEFERMIKIKDTTAILIQPMLSGMELFCGAFRDDTFGHLVMCGMGGIFVEVLNDVQKSLVSVSEKTAHDMIKNLKSYKLLEGIRGKKGIDVSLFASIVSKLSLLLSIAPEIAEIDLNPLLGNENGIVAVDARIKIEQIKNH